MRLGPRRDTYGIFVFLATGMVYFALGMVVGRGLFRPYATMPLLVACGVAMVALINGALWGSFYLLRRFAVAQKPPDTEESKS